jgi:outer membrane lipoprotein-sorting protein
MRSSFAILLVLVLVLGGCATGKSVTPPSQTAGFPSPQAALAAIDRLIDTHCVYQVTAKITLASPQGKMSFRLAVIVQSPDKLRLESIPVFGPPDFFLTAKRGRFRVYVPGTQEFFTGNAGPNNLSRFLPLAWSAEKWVAVLLGHRPDISSDRENIQGMMEGQLYRIDVLDQESVSERLWIEPENKRLEKLEQIDSSGLKDTILFSAFRETEGRTLPENIIIDNGEGTTIRIIYETLEIKKEANNDLFELSPPPGAIIRDLPD